MILRSKLHVLNVFGFLTSISMGTYYEFSVFVAFEWLIVNFFLVSPVIIAWFQEMLLCFFWERN